ncbi:protein indeterminate-domain 12 [Neltuma alba]|uniref:protein indeterminate-domain 12 n=1 Tax=Neltuma alba TaxID=207710 RepID=UPI0010A4C0E3|nr:protein indeterminate-domain 12-like [Prosopis alba]XP_028758423.1 protein indeterminate-domain 12-like [Prosopis alba]
MFPAAMSNSTTSLSVESSVSSATRLHDLSGVNPVLPTIPPQQPPKIKKKRSLPGNPDPDAEVIALSPKTLLATNRFVCEICNKGFQRDQNLQLHRRGHNLPWKLKQRNNKEVKKRAYVCPEPSCVHHNPSRALGDLTGIKKHYCRKHGEKKWKCEKCSKIYAVQSDWKAHSKTCGTREYRCDCGTLFSRKDSFITHRAFCDALAEESARLSVNQLASSATNPLVQSLLLYPNQHSFLNNPWNPSQENPNPSNVIQVKPEAQHFQMPPSFLQEPPHPHHKSALINTTFRNPQMPMQSSSNAATSAHLSATALLQKAATVGATPMTPQPSQSQAHHLTPLSMSQFGSVDQLESVVPGYIRGFATRNLKNEHLTRDFLGLTDDGNNGGDGENAGAVNLKNVMTFTGDVYEHHHHHSLFRSRQGFGFVGTSNAPETWSNY